MKLTKKYIMYLIRWQLSTPIIAIVISALSNLNPWVATVIANFIGGLIFFWVDRFIFKPDKEESEKAINNQKSHITASA